MKVAIMQPYLFPYIGYFQLMRESDVFVFSDDVQYIKDGWVNRNRIAGPDGWQWLTLPVRRGGHALWINQRSYVDDARVRRRLGRIMAEAYRGAPFHGEVMALFARMLSSLETNVARFNQACLVELAEVLGIGCRFEVSSALEKDAALRGESRVIGMCRHLGATEYINPIGGLTLYRRERFSAAGLGLRFLRARPVDHARAGDALRPFLSILDVLMFNGVEGARAMLNEFDFVDPLPEPA